MKYFSFLLICIQYIVMLFISFELIIEGKPTFIAIIVLGIGTGVFVMNFNTWWNIFKIN